MEITAQSGQVIADGDQVTVVLARGKKTPDDTRNPNGDYSERTVVGTVRAFDHVERVYDEEHIAVGKTSEVKWEILTGDQSYPAIGFTPESVLRVE